MADEQYEWLDKDAAEKLLRGEPVVPLGDQARDDAFRLAEALGAARATRSAPAGELPGEDAVLTAFRQAARTGGDRLAGRSAGPALPGRPGTLHSVHIGAAPAVPPRRPRWSRPVRFGLAVSLAGCALGGVAVAAGTGMFPGPFGGPDSPAPASSVSAATPEPLMSRLPADDPSAEAEPSPVEEPEPLSSPESRQPAASEEPSGATPGATAPAPDGDRTGDGNRPGGSGRTDATKDPATGRDDHPGGSGGKDEGGTWYEKSVKACKAFRAGTLDERSRRQLIELAKGEENLERFCDRLLGGGSGGPGSGGSGGGDHDGPGDGDGGSLPPVSFEPAPSVADSDRRADAGVRAEGVVPLRPATPAPTAPTAVLTR
ncbi:hypothetical protein GTY67_22155 [Streptomyces sp. SID8374]|uniref:hypothetical protein n=2 Tax=Streptomyces TaxID=1883 RepID=UPI00081EB1F5|nr:MULTISPECIES: hypothetical protein [unclassified Streptomyces]MYR95146.1 hypothetical protein [Streptomyces sp. SID4937]MYX16063.1 hypothetical protein [Streptomyces sp. SID8374]SCD84820.1 hypothetical protein GA0115243_104456 [Streptomyces sp. ScaeMP-e83]